MNYCPKCFKEMSVGIKDHMDICYPCKVTIEANTITFIVGKYRVKMTELYDQVNTVISQGLKQTHLDNVELPITITESEVETIWRNQRG